MASSVVADIVLEDFSIDARMRDLDAVVKAFDAARNHSEARPRVILFDTKMGKGVPFLEEREKNHFMQVDATEWQRAIDLLDRSHTATAGA